MTKWAGAIALTIGSSYASAAQMPPPTRSPTVRETRALCSDVATRGKDNSESSVFVYEYERTLWGIVDANPSTDSASAVLPRIQRMWAAHHLDFKCNSAGMQNGNILSYAVQHDFADLILDLAKNYRLDINFIDPAVGGTVLDYTQGEIDRLKAKQIDNGAQVKALESIYRSLRREAGAKHARELSGRLPDSETTDIE